MRSIRVSDLLAYYDWSEERIQVSIEDDGGWDCYIEIASGSGFLKPFYDWYIVSIGAETDDSNKEAPIIRISISQNALDGRTET